MITVFSFPIVLIISQELHNEPLEVNHVNERKLISKPLVIRSDNTKCLILAGSDALSIKFLFHLLQYSQNKTKPLLDYVFSNSRLQKKQVLVIFYFLSLFFFVNVSFEIFYSLCDIFDFVFYFV